MTIKKAIDRIHFRLSKMKMYQADVDAINTIIDYVNAQDHTAYMENLLFAKLFLEKFTSLAMTEKHDAKACLSVIESILETPLDDMVKKFADQVPQFKFNYEFTKYRNIKDPFNLDQIRSEHHRIANERAKELRECLLSSFTEEQAIDFVKNQVNRLNAIYNKEKYA